MLLRPIVIAGLIICSGLFTKMLAQPRTQSSMGFSGQFFLASDFRYFEDGEYENEFALKRGYITFKQLLAENVGVRFTQDVSVDQEGDGEGDIELRLKYAYLYYRMPDRFGFSRPLVEFGVVHRPWLNFEQQVNDFRSEENMFLDRNDIVSSADYGVTFSAGLGKPLDEEYRKGLKSNPGTFGSVEVGIYNGGGYSALEYNNNKVIESRLSLRPLPYVIPGFQVSFVGAVGKGNLESSPDYNLLAASMSYESRYINALIEAFGSNGDSAGKFVNPQNEKSYDLQGWSFFADVRPFNVPISLNTRYEMMYNKTLDYTDNHYRNVALAYIFPNKSKMIVSLHNFEFAKQLGKEDYYVISLIGEVRF